MDEMRLILTGKEITTITVVICGTIAYSVYVLTTQADGLVFGAFCTFLASVGGYVIGKCKA